METSCEKEREKRSKLNFKGHLQCFPIISKTTLSAATKEGSGCSMVGVSSRWVGYNEERRVKSLAGKSERKYLLYLNVTVRSVGWYFHLLQFVYLYTAFVET